MYEAEFHITVECFDTDKFKADCESVGLKPIVIETESNTLAKGIQVMTSHKTITDNIPFVLHTDVEKLRKLGYNVIRQKVEIKPGPIKHEHHVYYEAHIRLRLKDRTEYELVRHIAALHGFHWSKNLFKKEDGYMLQMITYRGYKETGSQFETRIINMKNMLAYSKIFFDKIELEECIYDSNTAIDKEWLTIGSKVAGVTC